MQAADKQVDLHESKSFLAKRIAIHPRTAKGPFRNFKTAVMLLAFVVYFALPWMPWDRHGVIPDQAILFDMVGRRFFIFNMALYPQDLISLSLLLFISAATLFFITGLIGRAFCGYFCFQTIWTDAFIYIEKWIQGERPARLRLDKQPWNGEKIAKKFATHLSWLTLSFWTAFSFILYFGFAPELTLRFFAGDLPSVAYLTVLILTLTTYSAAALLREQVCILWCPYSRFQGVMYEPETLIPYYDFQRGEGTAGRAPFKEGLKTLEERHTQGVGDCIDCELCVQVCPAGIDIRKGLQYPCISCGLCIDACNSVMDGKGYPRGLVRYDSEINIESPTAGEPHLELLRIRTLGYGIAIVVMFGALIFNLASRTDVQLSIQPVRQPLFVVMSDGHIRNRYQIHVTNKSVVMQSYRIDVRGIPEAAFDVGAMREIEVRPGKSVMVLANVDLGADAAHQTREFEFIVTPKSKPNEALVRKVKFNTKVEGFENEPAR
ncbi:MAG: cytochrome c oxidase accessory protein CcoG [Sulfuricella sp.]|nr:cytochrome c oxidase accessory protein CcoG [Sulfuricella sp.]